MKKLILRLFMVMLSVYLLGAVISLYASEGHHAPAPSAPPPPPAPVPSRPTPAPTGPPQMAQANSPPPATAGGCGGGGCGGQTLPSPPPVPPTPTGYLADGRPYYGTGTPSDPYRDYADMNQPSGGTTFGTLPAPPPPPAPPKTATTPKTPKAPETAKAPKTPETPKKPDKEPTKLESLNKSWDFWTSQYNSWANDMVAPKDQCEKNMKEAKEHLDSIKKDLAAMGKTPPSNDPTQPQYPPQTKNQTLAVNIYNNYQKSVDELRSAQGHLAAVREKAHLDSLTSFGIRAEDRESRAAEVARNRAAITKAESDVATAQAKADRRKGDWESSGFTSKYGALPDSPKIINDPGQASKDPRKEPRKVDAMIHKIKSTP